MKCQIALFPLMLALFSTCLAAGVRPLELPAGKGAVIFATPDSWKAVSSKTDSPIRTAALQLNSPANKRISHKTEMSIKVFDLSSQQAQEAANIELEYLNTRDDSFMLPDQQGIFVHGPSRPEKRRNDWKVYSSTGLLKFNEENRKPVEYRVREAYREMEGHGVLVRLAWPILQKHQPDYDDAMKTAFFTVIDSAKYKVKGDKSK